MKNQIAALRASLIVTLISILTISKAQERIFDMPCPAAVRNVEAIGVGDSILFSVVETGTYPKRRSYWGSTGKASELALPTGPFTTIKGDDGLYLYFLEKQKRSVVLRTYVSDNLKSLKITDMQVPIEGEILGFYEDAGLRLVILNRKTFSISFLTINKAKLTEEKVYKLPDELRWGDDDVDYYSPNSRMNSFKGFSNVRIFQERDFLYITIDHEKAANKNASTESKPIARPQGTTVVKLDLKTSEVSKSGYPISVYAPFGSFVMDGKLFRTLPNPKAFLVTVYDLQSKEMLHHDSIKPYLNFKCYFRYGKKSIIGHKAPFYTVMRESEESGPVIFVDRSQDGYEIQYGTYYSKAGGSDDNQKISDMVGSSILQYQEKPGVHRYFSYVVNDSSGHVKSDRATTTLRETIDDYEVENIPRIDYKTYFDYKDGVAGLYIDAASRRLFVIYYHLNKGKKSDPNSLGF